MGNMTQRERLLQAADELEATFRQSAQLARDNFKENRKEAVQLRRVISERVAAISALGASALEADLKKEFLSEFSKMRSTMAFHHASWPIVRIDLDDPEYLASVAQLRDSNNRFITWVRGALSVDGRGGSVPRS